MLGHLGASLNYGNFMNTNKSEYSKFIIDVFTRKYKQDCKNFNDKNIDKFNNHLFMITVKYNNDHIGGGLYNKLNYIEKQYSLFHTELSKKLIIGNRTRKIYQQPFCWMFVDAAATKYGGSFNDDRVGEGTHHHGVMLIHPSNINKFLELLENDQINAITRSISGIQNVDIRSFDELKSFKRIISYSDKLSAQHRYKIQIGDQMDFCSPVFSNEQLQKYIP